MLSRLWIYLRRSRSFQRRPGLIAEAADFFPLCFLRGRDRTYRHEAFRSARLFEDLLAVELGHASVLRSFLQLLVAAAHLLLAGVLGDSFVVQIVLQSRRHRFRIQHQRMLGARKIDLLAAGEDLMPAMLFVP